MNRECKHCSNGGTCVSLGDQLINYKCICRAGFDGRHCENVIDECESRLSVVCPPGSTCQNHFGNYTCNCPTGQILLRSACVQKLTCQDRLCRNSAVCYSVEGQHRDYVCECGLGFTGIHCEIRVRECSPVNVCGDHGVCVATTSGFRCYCLPGFSGKFCQWNRGQTFVSSSASPSRVISIDAADSPVAMAEDTVFVLAIGAGFFVGIVLLGCFLLYCVLVLKQFRIRQQRRTSKTRRMLFLQSMKDACLCWSCGQHQQHRTAVPGKRSSATSLRPPASTTGRLKILNGRIKRAQERADLEIRAFSAELAQTGDTTISMKDSLGEMQKLLAEF